MFSLGSADKTAGAAAIVVDDSASMQYRNHFAHAGQLCQTITHHWAGRARVFSATAGSDIEDQEKWECSNRAAGLNGAVQDALSWCRDTNVSQCSVYVLTDLQEGSLLPVQVPADQVNSVEFFLVDMGAPWSNAGVKSITLDKTWLSHREKAYAYANLYFDNYTEARALQWAVDGKVVGSGEVQASPVARVKLPLGRLGSGEHTVQIALGGADAFSVDDRCSFVLKVGRKRQRMLFVDQGSTRSEDSFFVREYMRDETLIIQTSTPGGIRSTLQDQSTVVISNVNSLTSHQWDVVQAYVRDGGHCIIFAGPRMDRAHYRDALTQRLMLPAIPRRVVGVAAMKVKSDTQLFGFDVRRTDGPLFALDAAPANRRMFFSRAEFSAAVELKPLPNRETRVHGRFNKSHMPVAVERFVGAGSITVVASSIDGQWAGIPARAANLEAWANLIKSVAADHTQGDELFVGDPIRIQGAAEIQVRDPRGRPLQVFSNQQRNTAATAPTIVPGLHGVVSKKQKAAHFVAVRMDPRETQFERMSKTMLESLFRGVRMEIVPSRKAIIQFAKARVFGRATPLFGAALLLWLLGSYVAGMRPQV
jgi:phage gp46-like protein